MPRRYYIEPDGVYAEDVSVVKISNGAQILRDYSAAAPRHAMDVFTTPGNQSWSLSVGSAYTVAVTRLRSLRLKTKWALAGDSFAPTFGKPGASADTISAAPDWIPPESMRLYFAFVVARRGPRDYGTDYPYLYATGPIPGTWQLPLTNHYGDGRLCLGRDMDVVSGETIAAAAEKLHALLAASEWKADGSWSEWVANNAPYLFKFDKHMQQLPPDVNWPAHCKRISPAQLEGAPTP